MKLHDKIYIRRELAKRKLAETEKENQQKYRIDIFIFAVCILLILFNIFDVQISTGKDNLFKGLEPLPTPQNASVQHFTSKPPLAPLTIDSSKLTSDVFFKFYNNEELIFSLFVKKGHKAKVEVPLGEYTVHYVTGEKWYGYDKLFGNNGNYSKFDKKLSFYIADNIYKGHIVTMNGVFNGNLPSSKISKNDF